MISPASSASNNHYSREVKIKDIIGNVVSGILYQWVNYGKGWMSRWFVLQDGILSFYKIHGPDKIVINQESRVIGEESMKWMLRNRNHNHNHNHDHDHHNVHKNGSKNSSSKSWKPIGQIHLKVSSIRECQSDDKRFSIFTGTKRLRLRAESREDRMAWMEALQTVKEMFPRISNSELMAPVDNLAVSTEKLKQRLFKEGVSQVAIQDSEQIMKDEYTSMQNQLLLLKHKQCVLMNTMRRLDVHVVISRISLSN
ncbi:Oxysterol-binding protein-related protein 1C [Abeliophyllum distichum]|uniref:Oxysterol-binding protein-related protein 1C n=1 Tax=Abeliophyllum distichum TaxID=126358 RepID=A0ABD1S932_9LAMI